jgi:hypothetical protein
LNRVLDVVEIRQVNARAYCTDTQLAVEVE